MTPTDEQLERLSKHRGDGVGGDDEAYHAEFDKLLEERLMELDPEWMTAMQALYKESSMGRWCA